MGLSHSPSIVTNGLVLCLDAANPKSYPGSGTTWYDLSGNGNHGTLTNGPTYDSNNGGSIVFDGVDDYVALSDNIVSLNGDWSISIWAKINSDLNPRLMTIITPTDNLTVGYMKTTLTPFIRIDNSSIISTSSLNTATWTNIVYQITNSVREIYINGIKTSTTSGGITANAQYSAVGGGYAGYCTNGNISISIMYYRALSAAEIAQNFAAHRRRYGI